MRYKISDKILLFFIGLFGILNVAAMQLNPIDIDRSKSFSIKGTPFYFWKMEYKDNAEGDYKPFLMKKDGTVKKALISKERSKIRFESGSSGAFLPSGELRGNDLNRSREVISSDGKWSVRFYWNMTYANDENNIQLIVKEIEKNREEKISVPTSSEGYVYPVIWSEKRDLFYFLIEEGDTTDRSFGLWQYSVENKSFCYVGMTDGRFFLSSDGKWIVWETGRALDRSGPGYPNYSVNLVLFDIVREKNYQLTEGKSVNLFDHWKN